MKAKAALPAFVWIAAVLSGNAGVAPNPGSDWPGPGRDLYARHCAACHGTDGDGAGPAAAWLFPKPRDFSVGQFKIQSTPSGSLPSDDDLLEVITRGMPGSSMPGFAHFSRAELRDLVEYVKELSWETDGEGARISRFALAEKQGVVVEPIPVPPEPPLTLKSLEQGRTLYHQFGCVACHGETGAGDGPSAAFLRDFMGMPNPPRDFNTDGFRGGHTGRDLYLRIATGMAGTTMPAFGKDIMSEEDRWAVVHFIQSLRRKEVAIGEILSPADGVIHARRISGTVPADPADSTWWNWEPARVALNPLWDTGSYPAGVALRTVHDGKRIAFLLQWRDDTLNGAPVRTEDFQDAAALQFGLASETPFIGMGDASSPVNIWKWRAGWQQEIDGPRPDIDTIHPSMYVDLYPERGLLHVTAAAAGNLAAADERMSPVEDSNARGFGTLEPQPPAFQNVSGRGIWRDGHWQVVFVRDLKSPDPDDIQFTSGAPVPLALAVWDGALRDRDGQKAVSNWLRLQLE